MSIDLSQVYQYSKTFSLCHQRMQSFFNEIEAGYQLFDQEEMVPLQGSHREICLHTYTSRTIENNSTWS